MGLFDRKKPKKGPPIPPRRPPASSVSPPVWHGEGQLQLVPVSIPSFQPAGLLPAPAGWTAGPPAPFSYAGQPPPIVVNQHYYLPAPPAPRPRTSGGPLDKLGLGSMMNRATDLIPGVDLARLTDVGHLNWHPCGTKALNEGAALYDQIASRFDNVMSLIDLDRYTGNENDLFVCHQPPAPLQPGYHAAREGTTDRSLAHHKRKHGPPPARDHPKGQTTAVAASVISGDYFAKVDLYANSRLPLNLPPLRLYIPTWPILCLAAQYSENVYKNPRGAERLCHVSADWRAGTKAMVIKSVPMDSVGTIVFAVRGTSTFMDWAVNLNMAPKSPRGFLDDEGNLCHAGFLAAARKMVPSVASRLRQLLQEDPSRAGFSLLVTGHSAGGAVAALLYAHMTSTSIGARSELRELASVFKRVHCVTFGTPPVSLLPLAKPDRKELRKSLFLSFVNEGDPVARADKAYVKSLLELFATPAPPSDHRREAGRSSTSLAPSSGGRAMKKEKSKTSLASSKAAKSSRSSASSRSGPVWKVPPSTLSTAGRIVVLRSGDPKARLKDRKTVEERLNEGVVAHVATDEHLRSIIWGDPVCHLMRLYAGRIETLAVAAVTGQH